MLVLDSGYTVKHNPPPSRVPLGFALGNFFRRPNTDTLSITKHCNIEILLISIANIFPYCLVDRSLRKINSSRNSSRKVNAGVVIENICIVTRVWMYDGIQPQPLGNPLGFALGISLGLRLYFIVYPSSIHHNTDTVPATLGLLIIPQQ